MITNPSILNDVTKCIGCEECVAACKKINHLPEEDAPPRVGRSPDGLTADRWTSVVRLPEGASVRVQCRHCLEPACVSVCPVGALQKTPQGPVVYDKSLCMGCRYCMMGCPFGIPRYEWNSLNPSVRKCILCFQQLASGEIDQPACIKACPTEATSFGTRDAMLAEARRRIDAEPGKYIDHIWGEHEVGGTAVLYISGVDLSFLAWQDPRQLGEGPLPDLTWAALRKVPAEFIGMGALMTGIWWVIDRRMRLQRTDSGEPGSDDAPEPPGERDG
jgi:formate dehydrogenase iron-sulfur subunit